MKSTTIEIPDDLSEALVAYGRDRGVPDLETALGAAVRDLLTLQGYLGAFRPFEITPAPFGGGAADVSVEHDRYFADAEAGRTR